MSKELRISPATNLMISEFSGGTITKISSGATNVVGEKYPIGSDGNPYLRQRPSLDIVEDASDTISDTAGRAYYYWSETSSSYFVNNDKIYKNTYGTVVGTLDAEGTERCYFLELNGYLVLLDPENNDGYIITSGDVLTNIYDDHDSDFPTSLVHGGAELNGRIYVMDSQGRIWGSDLDDPTSWDALNVISAERVEDGGVALMKHHDHLVAFGGRSIEFFYDAGNSVGSVLSRRQDLFYNTGGLCGCSFWSNGDLIWFVGTAPSGGVSVYMLVAFQLSKISTSDIDAYLTQSYISSKLKAFGAGYSISGHVFYLLTPYSIQEGNTYPLNTLVYDVTTQIWGIWSTELSELSSVNGIPLITWSYRSHQSLQYGGGILSNGDLIAFNDTLGAIDTTLGWKYVDEDFVENDYMVETTNFGTNIKMKMRYGNIEWGTNNRKFMRSLGVIADDVSSSSNIIVRWSDSDDVTFGTDRTLDLSKHRKLSNLGSFNRRTIEVEYSGEYPLRFEGMEFDIDRGYY